MKALTKILSGYKKYGIRGVIASLLKKGQIKDKDYALWFDKQCPTSELLERQKRKVFSYNPLFSIVVPVFNTPEKFLEEMICSVRNQSYKKWELCIANADPSNETVALILNRYGKLDSRIKVINVPENLGIAQNTNAAIQIAKGDYIGLLDHDDVLSLDALYEVAKCLNTNNKPEVVYTDEDKITVDGKKHFQPNFKPQFNLDMLRANNYICHFFVVKKSLLEQVGMFHEEYNGAQDHDLILRCTEKAKGIVRIPKILYHWRFHEASTSANPESKKYAYLSGVHAVEEHLIRCGEEGKVEMTDKPGFYRVKYKLDRKPFVSVVIVNTKHNKISPKVLESLVADYTRNKIEFLIIDCDKGDLYNKLELEHQCIWWEKKFDYIEMLNYGIKNAKGDFVLLLSPSVINISKNYMEEFVSIINRAKVGIVGGKLYYPDLKIKNAGLIIDRDGKIVNVFENLPKVCSGYMNRESLQQDLSAVILSDAIIKKKVWEKSGGFSNQYPIELCAIDFCKKVRELGWLVVYNPYSEAISRCKNKACMLKVKDIEDDAYNPNLKGNYSLIIE